MGRPPMGWEYWKQFGIAFGVSLAILVPSGTASAQVQSNQFPSFTSTGADACVQINAAIQALPATGGVVDARTLLGGSGPQNCGINPFIVPTNGGSIQNASVGALVTANSGTNTNWTPAQTGGALYCTNGSSFSYMGIVQYVDVTNQILHLTATIANSCTITGGQNSYVITGKSGTLLLGNATYSILVPWIIPDRWRVIGAGRGSVTNSTSSINPNGQATSIQATATFGPSYTTGTILTTAGVKTVGGIGTSWGQSLVGGVFLAVGSKGTVQGTVVKVSSTTNLTLSVNAQATYVNTDNQGFSITPAMIQFMPSSSYSSTGGNLIGFGVSISNLNADCNGITGGAGIQNWLTQEESYVQDVNITNCTGISLDVETSQAQNSGPYTNIMATAGSSIQPTTLCAEILTGPAGIRGIHGITCTASNATSPLVGIDLSSPGVTIEDAHIEGYTAGIEVGQNGQTNNATIINATANGGAGPVTSLIDISSNSTYAPTTEVSILGLNKQSPSPPTNILADHIMGTTLTTDSSLGYYILGVVTATSHSRITSSPNAPEILGSKVIAPASTASAASLNVPAGSAPTSPAIGDLWDLSGTPNILQFWDGSNTNSMVTIQSPVTNADLPQFSNTAGLLGDSGIAAANVPTQASNGANLQIATYTGSNKQLTAKSLADMNSTEYAAGTGSAQAQTVTLSPAATSLTAGLMVRWKPTAANTGSGPALAVNSLTATTITKCGTAALVANDLVTSTVAIAVYDGTQFELVNPQTGCGGGYILEGNSIGPVIPSGTQYMVLSGSFISNLSSMETYVQSVMPRAGTVNGIYAQVSAAEGSSATLTFTLRKNTASQNVTCTIGNSATTCNDTAHSFTFAAADLLDIQTVQSGTGTNQAIRVGVTYY